MPAPWKIKLIKFPPPGQEKTSNSRGMPGGGCLSFDLTGTLQLCLCFMASPFIFIQSEFEAPSQFINKKVINYERDDGKDKLPPGMSLSRQKLLLLYRARLLNTSARTSLLEESGDKQTRTSPVKGKCCLFLSQLPLLQT